MKYTVEMASDGMIYISCLMKIGLSIQVILRLLPRQSDRLVLLLLLLMGKTYYVCLEMTSDGMTYAYQEKYKWESEHNKLLKRDETRYYSINTPLLAQMLMLHVSTFL
jgi:hypothetical protein